MGRKEKIIPTMNISFEKALKQIADTKYVAPKKLVSKVITIRVKNSFKKDNLKKVK